jgi:hypothetical protein
MKRSCQRQIVGLPLPVCRWIAIVPTPSALSSTIRARHACFCELFPDPITASSRSRSPAPSRTSTPFLIRPDSHICEPAGIIRQRLSTLMSAISSSRQASSWLSFKRLFQALPGRAGGAVVETTVDHTLMRGLEPHDR